MTLKRRPLLRFGLKSGSEGRLMEPMPFCAVLGFVLGGGISLAIILLKRFPMLLTPSLWNVRSAIEEILSMPGYFVGLLIDYKVRYTSDVAAGPTAIICITNGALASIACASMAWTFKKFQVSFLAPRNGTQVIDSSSPDKLVVFASWAFVAGGLVTLCALGLPFLVRYGTTSAWFASFAWPVFATAASIVARAFNWDLATSIHRNPLGVILFCALINALLLSLIAAALCRFATFFARTRPKP